MPSIAERNIRNFQVFMGIYARILFLGHENFEKLRNLFSQNCEMNGMDINNTPIEQKN
jgi:hypothetical protein